MSALKPILYALTAALAAVLVTTTSALAGSGVAQRRLHQRWQHLLPRAAQARRRGRHRLRA